MRISPFLLAVCLWALLLSAAPAGAHDLQYGVSDADAILVEVTYPDGSPFAYEAYEIYEVGKDVPYQVGRTNAHGRIAFVAPEPGRYRVQATSEDGHGVVFEFEAGDWGVLSKAERPLIERYQRLFIGLGVLLGIFGLISLFYRGRKR